MRRPATSLFVCALAALAVADPLQNGVQLDQALDSILEILSDPGWQVRIAELSP